MAKAAVDALQAGDTEKFRMLMTKAQTEFD
jgi:hypothetical protein